MSIYNIIVLDIIFLMMLVLRNMFICYTLKTYKVIYDIPTKFNISR